MRIAIAGATGSIGAPVAEELAGRGHEVRALSRRSSEYPIDLETGAGLAQALEGCDALVDASNAGPSEKRATAILLDGGRRLLDAAAAAGVGHHVCISIIGIDRVRQGYAYYRIKLEQEALAETSEIPYSIVRATQFHTLLDMLFSGTSRLRLLPGGAARIQPVENREVAAVIADRVEGGAIAGHETVAGPEVLELGEMARLWKAARGVRAAVVPAPLPPKLGRAVRGGALTDPAPDHRGTIGWGAWLTEQTSGPEPLND
jgi:uncharacterized protein YbjT (DUF2867 family)